jgi:hypothetical protein
MSEAVSTNARLLDCKDEDLRAVALNNAPKTIICITGCKQAAEKSFGTGFKFQPRYALVRHNSKTPSSMNPPATKSRNQSPYHPPGMPVLPAQPARA